jgi:hypothetical protein
MVVPRFANRGRNEASPVSWRFGHSGEETYKITSVMPRIAEMEIGNTAGAPENKMLFRDFGQKNYPTTTSGEPSPTPAFRTSSAGNMRR